MLADALGKEMTMKVPDRRCNLRRLRIAFVALAAWAGAAGAAEYVVLSLVGDRITVVSAQTDVGTHLDPNDYTVLPVTGTLLDDTAIVTVEDGIRGARPGATVTKLRATGRAAYAVGDGWLKSGTPEYDELISVVAKAVPTADSLLLVAPYRTTPQFLTYEGYRGQGSVAGLGFYLGAANVDRESLPGFLGVFANLQLALVDMKTKSIVAQQPIIAGKAHSSANSRGVWDTLPADQKVEALRALEQDQIRNQLSQVLGAARP